MPSFVFSFSLSTEWSIICFFVSPPSLFVSRSLSLSFFLFFLLCFCYSEDEHSVRIETRVCFVVVASYGMVQPEPSFLLVWISVLPRGNTPPSFSPLCLVLLVFFSKVSQEGEGTRPPIHPTPCFFCFVFLPTVCRTRHVSTDIPSSRQRTRRTPASRRLICHGDKQRAVLTRSPLFLSLCPPTSFFLFRDLETLLMSVVGSNGSPTFP